MDENDIQYKTAKMPPLKTVVDTSATVSSPFTCEEIAGVFGGLGSGKSNHAWSRFIWPELTRGERTIVTNLPIRKNVLRALIQKRTNRSGDEVNTRIRILPEKQMREFWLHRGLDKDGNWWDATDVEPHDKARPVERAILDYNLDHPHARPNIGVLYVYDEAHNGFRAKSFQSFSLVAEWYFNHVRKATDTVVLVTPHPDQLDKTIRNLLGNVWMMRNSGKERFMTYFRGPSWINYTLYLGPYEKTMVEQASGRYMLDKELADCYDTSGGASLTGGGTADVGNKPPGLPFWTITAGLVGVVVVCLIGLKLFGMWWHYEFSMDGDISKAASAKNQTHQAYSTSSNAISSVQDGLRSVTVSNPAPVYVVQQQLPEEKKYEHIVPQKHYFSAIMGSSTNCTIVSEYGDIIPCHYYDSSGYVVQSFLDGSLFYFRSKLTTRDSDKTQIPYQSPDLLGGADRISSPSFFQGRTLGSAKKNNGN